MLLFQFQHGAVKVKSVSVVRVAYKIFQFQHGAVKVRRLGCNVRLMTIFQFQHGAVKVYMANQLAMPQAGDFNSNMVRLKSVKTSTKLQILFFST